VTGRYCCQSCDGSKKSRCRGDAPRRINPRRNRSAFLARLHSTLEVRLLECFELFLKISSILPWLGGDGGGNPRGGLRPPQAAPLQAVDHSNISKKLKSWPQYTLHSWLGVGKWPPLCAGPRSECPLSSPLQAYHSPLRRPGGRMHFNQFPRQHPSFVHPPVPVMPQDSQIHHSVIRGDFVEVSPLPR
jgi:hypothetical protein